MSTAEPGMSLQEFADMLVNQVAAAVADSNLNRACELANFALSRGVQHPSFFNARGLWLQGTGQFDKALENFQRALTLSPGNGAILNAIGLCYLKLEQLPEAIKSFDAALAANPNDAQGHYRKGLALAAAGHHDQAKAAFERAVEIDPNHANAIASLASIAARNVQAETARALAQRALALDPHQATAQVAEAIVDLSERRFAEAEARLKKILAEGYLPKEARSTVLGLLGDAYDGQKRYAEAFTTYCAENEELRREHGARFAAQRGADSAQHLISYFENTPAEIWKSPDDGASSPGEPAQHVFLLGFMRSGTTLLEQVLASNPQIVALEEKGLLHGLGDLFMTSNVGLHTLSKIGVAELARHRALYWQRVRNNGLEVSGKIFVDKQPLNTIKLPIIAKLFPKAKILFALRDPRDVVFSCFRRHFRINVTMFEFLSLEDAAKFYASIMRLAELYRAKLPLSIFDTRYEELVSDFDTQVRLICEFIGAEWTDAMRNFSRNAPTVDLRSPSATQVRKPLYGEGVAQWRHYATELAPILPVLQPWVQKFGYPGE
jgi:tetratricopeptide (TPR) repeat protein